MRQIQDLEDRLRNRAWRMVKASPYEPSLVQLWWRIVEPHLDLDTGDVGLSVAMRRSLELLDDSNFEKRYYGEEYRVPKEL